MRQKLFIGLACIAVALFTSSCVSAVAPVKNAEKNVKKIHICLVVDGSDRIANHSGIDFITTEDLITIAKELADKCVGSLFVTYVDSDSANNTFIMFEHDLTKPTAPGEKSSYVKFSVHQDKMDEYANKLKSYNSNVEKSLEAFKRDCNLLLGEAYSDAVALNTRGSDINNALNKAQKLLSSGDSSANNYIVLISDCLDNVGGVFNPLPSHTKLIIVNSSTRKHPYNATKEFAVLAQARNYIFR